MESIRNPLPEELKLIELLVDKANINLLPDWRTDLLVCPMEDGNMGSLLLLPNGIETDSRSLGKIVSEYQFKDEDGVEVIASLNVDQNGILYELDIWKTDFSPLIKFPTLAC